MPLPNFWSKEETEPLIEHYRQVSQTAAAVWSCLMLTDTEKGTPKPTPSATFALARAAELAFATDDMANGRAICTSIVRESQSGTPMELVLRAMAAAILREGLTVVRRAGFRIDGVRLPWPETVVEAAEMGRMLITAEFASWPRTLRQPQPMGRIAGPNTIVVDAITNSLEYRAMQALRAGAAGDDLAALYALEAEYTRRLRLIMVAARRATRPEPEETGASKPPTPEARRSARERQKYRDRGSLIDWPLLMLWIGYCRRSAEDDRALDEELPASPEAKFIRQLARKVGPMHQS